MRLYLDQMFRHDLAQSLRDHGHNVLCAGEAGQASADDDEILSRAIAEERILVTMDEHFGDWAILPLARHPGVIRVRTHPATTENVAGLLLPFVMAHKQEELRNHLIILSRISERWTRTAENDR